MFPFGPLLMMSMELSDSWSDDDDDDNGNSISEHGNNGQLMSLQDKCFETIVRYFPRFHNAYSTTQDSFLQKNLQFLRRAYSLKLSQKLVEEDGNIKDEYLEFVLNEHLKALKMKDISECSPTKILGIMKEVGHGFSEISIDCSSNEFSEGFIRKFIEFIPNVQVLTLSVYDNDETLKAISSVCQSLKTLNLFSKKYTNNGIISLIKALPSLEVLECKDLPRIIYHAHKHDLANNTLSSVRKYKFSKLNFVHSFKTGAGLSDVINVCAAVCPFVKIIHAEIATLKDLQLICLFAEMEKLNIESIEFVPSLDDLLLARGDKLVQLNVTNCHITLSVLLQNCPNMKSLILGHVCCITADDDSSKLKMNKNSSFLKHLEELNFTGFLINMCDCKELLKVIASCKIKLVKLSLVSCDLEEHDIKAIILKLCSNGTLKYLSLKSSRAVTVQFAESVLRTCSSLETLVIDGCVSKDSDNVINLRSINEKVTIVYTDRDDSWNEFEGGDYDNFDIYTDEDDIGDYFDGYDDGFSDDD